MSSQWSAYPHQIPLVIPKQTMGLSPDALVREFHACMHRRGGKTESSAVGKRSLTEDILAEDSVFKLRKNIDSWDPKIAFLAETKENARNIVWGMFKRLFSQRKDAKLNNHRLTIEIPRPHIGDTFELSLHAFRDHDKLRGQKFRHIHLDERQNMIQEHFDNSIYSTLADSGGSCYTTGTATSLGDYKDFLIGRIQNGFPVMIVNVDQTNVFDEKEKASILASIGPFAYRQEYMCDFSVSSKGTFWESKLLELEKEKTFLTARADDSRFKVLAVDIGVDEGFAAWYVQVHENGLHFDVLDYYTGYETLNQLREDHLNNHEMFDAYIIPSDSKTRRLESLRSRTSLDVFMEVFPECRPIRLKQSTDSYLDVEIVTQNLHMLRFPPKSTSTDAHLGLNWLKKYRRKEDAKGNVTRQIYKGDKSSHCGDALKYLFLGLKVKHGRAHYVPSFRVGVTREDMLYSWVRNRDPDYANQGRIIDSMFKRTGGFNGL